MDSSATELLVYNKVIQNKLKGLLHFVTRLKGQRVPRQLRKTLLHAVSTHKLLESHITQLFK